MKTRVAAADAKLLLDKLLSHTTKSDISRRTGISYTALSKIDNLSGGATVEKSVVDMLAKFVVEHDRT